MSPRKTRRSRLAAARLPATSRDKQRITPDRVGTIAHPMRRLRTTTAARILLALLAALCCGALPQAAHAQTADIPTATTPPVPLPLDQKPDPWELGDDISRRLDERWSASRGLYTNDSGGLPDTRLNALMLQLHGMAALAGHVGAIRQDDRIGPMVDTLTKAPVLVVASLKPRKVGHFPHAPAWTPAIGENPEQATLHPSIDTAVVRALRSAWRARDVIGMSQEQRDRIPLVLSSLARSKFYKAPERALNQINWHTEVYSAALEVAGDTSVLVDYRAQLAWFAEHAHVPAYPGGSPNLTSGGGFRYLPNRAKGVQLNRVETTEYGNLALSSLGFYEAAIRAGMVPLPAADLAILRGWSKHMLLGSWTHAGYPNWDTGLGTHRRHLRQYWAWSLDGLIAASNQDSLLSYPKQRGYARQIVSNGIALYLRTAWNSDMALVDTPLPGKTSFDAPNGFSSGSGSQLISPLRFAVLDAALDGRFQNVTAATPPSWFAHDQETGRLALSTASYNTAIVPSRSGQGQGGIEPVRLFDGTQNPITSLGGRGTGSLGVSLSRNGAIGLDTQAAVPSRQATGDIRLVGPKPDSAASFGRQLRARAGVSSKLGRINLQHRFTAKAMTTKYSLIKVDKRARVTVRIPVWGATSQMTITRGATRQAGLWVRNSAPLQFHAIASSGGRMSGTLTGIPSNAKVAVIDVRPSSYQPLGAKELVVVFSANQTQKATKKATKQAKKAKRATLSFTRQLSFT